MLVKCYPYLTLAYMLPPLVWESVNTRPLDYWTTQLKEEFKRVKYHIRGTVGKLENDNNSHMITIFVILLLLFASVSPSTCTIDNLQL